MIKGTCLLCFAVNVKIFDIKDTHLQSVYEEIADFKIQNDSHTLCYVCRARLQQCYVLVKQTLNLKKFPQDDSNEIEHNSFVQLTTFKVENTSINREDFYPYQVKIKHEPDFYPDHVTIMQEPNRNVKEDNSDYINEEDVESNTENFKCEPEEETATSSSCGNEIKQDKSIHTGFKEDSIEGENAEETNILYRHRLKEQKLYTCDICNKKFNQSSNLKRHTLTHTGEKPYWCNICSQKFNQSSSLKSHKITHTVDKPYTCDVCHKKFSQNIYLKRHKWTHTDDKPHSCDICNKKFIDRYHLNTHRITHTGDKPYYCDICNKNYSDKSKLNRHKKLKNHLPKERNSNQRTSNIFYTVNNPYHAYGTKDDEALAITCGRQVRDLQAIRPGTCLQTDLSFVN